MKERIKSAALIPCSTLPVCGGGSCLFFLSITATHSPLTWFSSCGSSPSAAAVLWAFQACLGSAVNLKWTHWLTDCLEDRKPQGIGCWSQQSVHWSDWGFDDNRAQTQGQGSRYSQSVSQSFNPPLSAREWIVVDGCKAGGEWLLM